MSGKNIFGKDPKGFNFLEWERLSAEHKDVVVGMLKKGLNGKITDDFGGEEEMVIPKKATHEDLFIGLENKTHRGITLLHNGKPVAFVAGRYFEKENTALVSHMVAFNIPSNVEFYKKYGTVPSEALLRKFARKRKKNYNILMRTGATNDGLSFFKRLVRRGNLEKTGKRE